MRREAASCDVVTSRSADRVKLSASERQCAVVVAPHSVALRFSFSASISVTFGHLQLPCSSSLARDILPRLLPVSPSTVRTAGESRHGSHMLDGSGRTARR